jgi:hypothetical protein
MLRFLAISALGAAALAGPTMAQAPKPRLAITERAIGPVRAGATESELTGLGLPFKRTESNREGDPVTEIEITVDGGNKATAVMLPGEPAYEVITRSPGFETAAGAHVGQTLAELQKLYPKGEVFIAQEEGKHLAFFLEKAPDQPNGKLMAFNFDASDLNDDCFYKDKCPDFSGRRARSFRIAVW